MTKKYNLVIDLDETLVNSVFEIDVYYDKEQMKECQNYLMDDYDGNNHYVVFYRNHVFECLNYWSEYFNLYIYTLSTNDYCNKIIEKMREKMGWFQICGIWTREGNNDKTKIKKLSFLGLNANNTIIIDDNIHVWCDKLNVLQIEKYYYYMSCDDKLLQMIEYVNQIIDECEDTKISLQKIIPRYNGLLNCYREVILFEPYKY